MLSAAPRPGANTILITHKPNIIDALGKDWFDVKEGEASIFRPENGSAKLVARIQMEEWPQIAAANDGIARIPAVEIQIQFLCILAVDAPPEFTHLPPHPRCCCSIVRVTPGSRSHPARPSFISRAIQYNAPPPP
jgi:hypothetical protein